MIPYFGCLGLVAQRLLFDELLQHPLNKLLPLLEHLNPRILKPSIRKPRLSRPDGELVVTLLQARVHAVYVLCERHADFSSID